MLPPHDLHLGPSHPKPPPPLLPINGEAGVRVQPGLPVENYAAYADLYANVPISLELNTGSDPLYLYYVEIDYTTTLRNDPPPVGPYAIYILSGGKIRTRILDREVASNVDAGGVTLLIPPQFPMVRACPFADMPWAINRQEELVFIFGMSGSDTDIAQRSTPPAPSRVGGLIVKYILRR